MAGVPDPAKFIVTYQSIIPNLKSLRGVRAAAGPLLRPGDVSMTTTTLLPADPPLRFTGQGDPLGEFPRLRSLRFVPRRALLNRIGRQCYFDSMLHFDFVTLLPALLQVEDRMSMAHGIESRTPFLDHPLVEFDASVPANVKFKDGELELPAQEGLRRPAARLIFTAPTRWGFPCRWSIGSRANLRPMVHERLSAPSGGPGAGVPRPRGNRQGPG